MQNYRTKTDINTNQTESTDMGLQSYGFTSFSCVSEALRTCVSEHRRAMEKRDFSASALAQHAWEHNHHINWTSTCVLGVESHYQSRISREAIYIRRQPSSLNRDRGALSDMYDFIIL